MQRYCSRLLAARLCAMGLVSACFGSLCTGSGCLISACGVSLCLQSECITSGCDSCGGRGLGRADQPAISGLDVEISRGQYFAIVSTPHSELLSIVGSDGSWNDHVLQPGETARLPLGNMGDGPILLMRQTKKGWLLVCSVASGRVELPSAGTNLFVSRGNTRSTEPPGSGLGRSADVTGRYRRG